MVERRQHLFERWLLHRVGRKTTLGYVLRDGGGEALVDNATTLVLLVEHGSYATLGPLRRSYITTCCTEL